MRVKALPPRALTGFSTGLPQETQRPRSSDIMEELLSQGNIPEDPRDRAWKTGEGYNIMVCTGTGDYCWVIS